MYREHIWVTLQFFFCKKNYDLFKKISEISLRNWITSNYTRSLKNLYFFLSFFLFFFFWKVKALWMIFFNNSCSAHPDKELIRTIMTLLAEISTSLNSRHLIFLCDGITDLNSKPKSTFKCIKFDPREKREKHFYNRLLVRQRNGNHSA